MVFTCPTEPDLFPAAEKLILGHPGSRVFALYGNMGAGKTTFIKVLCRVLEVVDTIQSPTFSIINEYMTTAGKSVFHFDFYRINKLEEVYDLGYEDYIYSGSYCFLEWPGLIDSLLPAETVKVSITENLSDGSRLITF
ncbi:MAG: tRNA (adenosine(37)-N6)-threonylcarbamoyltransferase complex ATPase subunit type 1 TsaE [Bacteroidota bacterium]